MALSENLRAILGELRKGYEALYGDRLAAVVLFGSQARGDADPGSDIDLMVVLKGSVNASEEGARTDDFLAAICLQFDVLITSLYISEDRFRQERSPLLVNVRREGIPV